MFANATSLFIVMIHLMFITIWKTLWIILKQPQAPIDLFVEHSKSFLNYKF